MQITKQVVARIYMRENAIVLRMFLSDIDKHKSYIENSDPFIKDFFISKDGDCNHCKDNCAFRKVFSIENKTYEKCSGVVFEFYNPSIERIKGYVELFDEFYSKKQKASSSPSTARAMKVKSPN